MITERLIAPIGSDFENYDYANRHKPLFRFVRDQKIPRGFEDVSKIEGRSVRDNEGALFPQFWALKRYQCTEDYLVNAKKTKT